MFLPRQIVYFKPFYFKNGNTSKNKYFIVLKTVDDVLIVASLPTRTCKAPALITHTHGCNNDNARMFNCYVFEAERQICENGFAFPLATYIYGNEIEDYSIETMKAIYPIEGIDYEIIGELATEEYNNIIDCMKQSSAVKRKLKRLL